MRKLTVILSTVFIVLFVFQSCKQSETEQSGLIVVDVTKKHSHRKDLILQDFMDVEYIALETNDDFINQGFVKAIGNEIILVTNRNDDGDIFVYDRRGKALRKINRRGQGGEEYSNIFGIILDEEKNEIFVNDIFERKIFVYDLYGNFKRSFKHTSDTPYIDIFNYDIDNFICYDQYNKETPFFVISKQNGSVVKEIKIPFQEKIHLWQQSKDEASDMVYTVTPGPRPSIIPFEDKWLLIEHSSDTVYTLLPDKSLHPFLVRTPGINTIEPKIFLSLRLLSDRYYFMEAVTCIFDFNAQDGFPTNYFMYDKQEKDFFRYIVYNGDYTTKEEIYMSIKRPVSHEVESWYPLEAH